jgi:hypothetical protein
MLVTNFKLKYVIYKIVCAFYQLWDVGRIHPMRERSLRALQRTTDYIERAMPDAIGFEAPAEVLAFALKMVNIEGHYLEFGVFTGHHSFYRTKDWRPHHSRLRQLPRPARGLERLQSRSARVRYRRSPSESARQCAAASGLVRRKHSGVARV